ncbi:peptidase M14 [Natronorubrum sp. JWXQ-INN-674]|uniref:Peptidase M14 n=1 Tax=Natronorubrum halalkaliphilum TaxID=2691917 RepID=A0A6B0VJH7_9EURY|nr:M14-type cytosolic carboxypeptidase [Natronorubrum halalkaliphilum]MXV61116.1 peptidase M14 [Natronorubrum halalkaliphilum]
MPISTTTDFDGGGGAVKCQPADTHVEIEMVDAKDYDYLGYFHFKLEGAAGETVSFEITNREETGDRMSEEYQLVYSETPGPGEWSQFDDAVEGGFEREFDDDTVSIASWPAYPYESTVERVDQLAAEYPALVETDVIGESYEGREMHSIRITDPAVANAEKTDIVCTTRQHPGETHGSYQMDAIIDRAINRLNGSSGGFVDDYVFHFLPNLNPDGMYHGYHYDDARGNNHNREWDTPGPVEIDNARNYLLDEVSDLHWAFDLHASTDGTHDAVRHWESNMSDAHLGMIDDIEAASLSLSGTSVEDDPELARGWLHSELPGDGSGVTTEAWTYYGYRPAELEREGSDFLAAVTTPLEEA